MITIGIIDDHGIVLQGVSAVFSTKKEFKVVFAINNLPEANTTLEQTQPQVLFLDINIKGDDGLEALKIFKKKYTACLLYTSPSPRDRTRSRMPSSA